MPAPEHPPEDDDSAFSAWLLAVLCTAVAVTMMGIGIIWPHIPVYAMQIGTGGFEVGLIIASFNVARSFAGPLMGRWSDVWGRKSFMTVGLVCYAGLSLLYIRADDVVSLVAVRLAHGIAAVMITPIAMALVADTAPADRLGRNMGTLSMAMMLGLGVGPVLGGLISTRYGLPSAFYTMGGLALAALVGVAVFVPGGGSDRAAVHTRHSPPLRILLRQTTIQGLGLLRLFTAAGQGCVYTFLPLLAVELHVSSAQVGVLLGTNIYLIAVLQRISGNLADRTDPIRLLLGGTLLSGAAVLAMPLAATFAPLLILNVVMGTGTGIATAAGFVLAGRVGRDLGQGAVMGVTDAGWSMGMIAAPILSGIVMDWLGMPAIFYTGGAIIIVGTGLVAHLLRR